MRQTAKPNTGRVPAAEQLILTFYQVAVFGEQIQMLDFGYFR